MWESDIQPNQRYGYHLAHCPALFQLWLSIIDYIIKSLYVDLAFNSSWHLLLQTGHSVPSQLAPSGPASGGVATIEDPVTALKKMSVKATNSLSKISDGGQEEGAEPAKRDADAYQEAKTYVFLEMELHRALIAKRPASVLAERYVGDPVQLHPRIVLCTSYYKYRVHQPYGNTKLFAGCFALLALYSITN